MLEEAAGFWSYVQADDEADGGRITSLATRLQAHFRLQTAEELLLFVDRESLAWGEEWAKRIEEAIAGTTFFIPIITPSYFRSQACRQELLKFTREANRLGLEQLLMPVYWVSVPELEADPESSADEAIRLTAKHEWRDLRQVRLEDEDSSIFRKAVNGLAGELAKRATKVTNTVEDIPGNGATVEATVGDPAGDEEPGIIEQLAAAEEAFPQLTEITEGMNGEVERVGELIKDAGAKMEAADARGQGMKARLSITEGLARDLSGPAERLEELGHQFAGVLTSLDPGVHALLDLAADDEAEEHAQATFLTTMQELATNADEALGELESLVEATREAAQFSRSLRAPLRRMRTGLQSVLDGRALIEEWGRRAADTEAEAAASDDVGKSSGTGDENSSEDRTRANGNPAGNVGARSMDASRQPVLSDPQRGERLRLLAERLRSPDGLDGETLERIEQLTDDH
jgi:hypothetical protein